MRSLDGPGLSDQDRCFNLRDTLGLRFAERPGTDPAKRPIREVVGVDPRLNQHWSTRRAQINNPPR
jgi:hypothetical protein